MANLLYYLAKSPERQEKLRDEIKNLPLDVNGKLTPSSFLKAPYLRACLKEVMRLAPIVPGTARAAGKDLILKGYHIPKGVRCYSVFLYFIFVLIFLILFMILRLTL